MIIEYARIPFGDKLKISKTIKRKEEELKDKGKGMKEAKKSVGLGGYSDMQARMIMSFAGGESKDHIEYGIEQLEDGMKEMERMVNIAMIKDPRCVQAYDNGTSMARMINDPTYQLLQSFGYETFEYTNNKTVDSAVVPDRPTSSDSVVETLLLGNMTSSHSDDPPPSHMYS